MGVGMYRLNTDGNPVAEPDTLAWARWFETADRVLARDKVGSVEVSTVFLALDHNYGDGPPLLWETMTFADDESSDLHNLQDRYASRIGALEGHKAMMERVSQ